MADGTRRFLLALAVVLCVVLVLGGLALIAFVVLAIVALNNFGSNK